MDALSALHPRGNGRLASRFLEALTRWIGSEARPELGPELATNTFPFTTNGAMVMVSPLLKSPSFTFHFSMPVAIVWLSTALK
jgi:hypothetical protein